MAPRLEPDDGADGHLDEDEFYDEDAGDFLNAYGNSDGYFQDEDGFYFDAEEVPAADPRSLQRDEFPPPISKWGLDVGVSERPTISFDKAKAFAWEQCKKEVNFVRGKLQGLHVTPAVDRAFDLLFGIDSELFARFKTKISADFETHCLFMATFYFECSFSVTYRKLYEDTKVDTTDLMDVDAYLGMWEELDGLNKKQKYKERFWEEVEKAYNDTAKELVMPCGTPPEFKIQVTMDDDKQWWNDTVSRKDIQASLWALAVSQCRSRT